MGLARVFADLVPLAATAALSFLLTGLAAWYARRRGMLDHPGERHSHRVATPRGGGVGLVLALAIATATWAAPASTPGWLACVAPCALALAALGWWDDHRSLGAALRFFVQLAVSLGLVACAAMAGWLQGAPMMLVGLVFLLWMSNLYNFMDGSNGMAGLQGVFAAIVTAWLFHGAGDAASAGFCLFLAAACAGFLPWNLGRARVFMGDVGSLFLGFLIAALLLYGVASGKIGAAPALLVMAVFLVDASLTLAGRVLRGERWYNAHRQHLYQRLIAHGWPHGRVAALYQAINLSLVLPAIWVADRFPVLAWPVALLTGSVLGLGWYVLTRKIRMLAKAG